MAVVRIEGAFRSSLLNVVKNMFLRTKITMEGHIQIKVDFETTGFRFLA